MNTFLGDPVVQAIGWALLHFIWQGALLAAVLFLTNRITKSPKIRYAAGCAVMLMMPAVFLATVLRTGQPVESRPNTSVTYQEPLHISPAANPDGYGASVAISSVASAAYDLSAIPGWIACLWLVGVAALSIFTSVGWLRTQQLTRRNTKPINPAWLEATETLKRRLKIAKPIRLCISAIAEVPTVIGWLRPCILLPVSAITGLDESQLRAIVAHELAHIRRHDYLVNLLQNAIETLLFYHPAVWWVSRQIRHEREHCCDDLAVEVCGDVMLYASALAQLEEQRSSYIQPALAATGGDLLARIRRITSPQVDTAPSRIAGSIAAVTIAALIVVALLSIARAPAIHAQSPAPGAAETTPATPIPTPPTIPSLPVVAAPPRPDPPPSPRLRSQIAPKAPEFEVASVKPWLSTGALPKFTGGPGTADPGRITWENIDLRRLLMRAYGMETDQISGPSWIDSEKYSIIATLPPDTTPDQFQIMLQNLLTERFALVLHHDTKEFTVYELIVAKGGPKLAAAATDPNGDASPAPSANISRATMELDKEGCPVASAGMQAASGLWGPGTSCSRFVKQSLTGLAKSLEIFVAAEEGLSFGSTTAVHVIDKTGLTGEYDFTLKFHFMPNFPWRAPVAGQASDPDGDSGPTIFTALEQQLGLKLQKVKQTLDRIVIDQANKIPSAN